MIRWDREGGGDGVASWAGWTTERHVAVGCVFCILEKFFLEDDCIARFLLYSVVRRLCEISIFIAAD